MFLDKIVEVLYQHKARFPYSYFLESWIRGIADNNSDLATVARTATKRKRL